MRIINETDSQSLQLMCIVRDDIGKNLLVLYFGSLIRKLHASSWNLNGVVLATNVALLLYCQIAQK
jgi:hypothetical protein